MKIEIEPFWDLSNQKVETFGDGDWLISDLIEKAKGLTPFEIPLVHLNLRGMDVGCEDVVEFARHYKHVEAADLSYPIILDYKGTILDGRHRIIKALLEGRETITAVRFAEYVTPTYPPEK